MININPQSLFRIAIAVSWSDEVDYKTRTRIANDLKKQYALGEGEMMAVEVSQDDCAIIASVCLRGGINDGKLFAIAGAPEKVETPETVTRDDVLAAEKAFEELQQPVKPEMSQGSLF